MHHPAARAATFLFLSQLALLLSHAYAYAYHALHLHLKQSFSLLKSAPLRPVVVPAVLATPMTEVALRCVVPVPCPVWGWG